MLRELTRGKLDCETGTGGLMDTFNDRDDKEHNGI